METLQAHRERVGRLREQFERMLQLRQAIYDAREESWDLRTHWEAARESRINELHDHIDAMAEEVELIREAHFGATVMADRMGHAVSVPESVLAEEAPRGRPARARQPAPAPTAGLDGKPREEADAAAAESEPDTIADDGLDALMSDDALDA